MLWGLTCIKIHYGDKMRFPYIQGEPYNGTTSAFQHTYNDYLPFELVTMGAISFCLFLVNIGCIFITAVVVLKVISSNK